MLKYFNEENIKKSAADFKKDPRGFRYGIIEGLFKEDVYAQLIKMFPDTSKFKLVDKQSGGGRKRFYTGPNYYSGDTLGCFCHMKDLPEVWNNVLIESGSEEFIKLLESVTGVRQNSLCNFGFTYGNEGCVQEPHIDGAARPNDPNPIHATIACLMYFNAEPGGSSGTAIYDNDRKTILAQVLNMRNSLFFFEQHPEAWHGFPIMGPGSERRLVSLSYSQEKPMLGLKTSAIHSVLCLNKAKNYLRALKRGMGK